MATSPGQKQPFFSRLLFSSLKDLILCSTNTQSPSPQPEAPPPVHPVMATLHQSSSSSTIPATTQQLGSVTPQENPYVAIGGLPDMVAVAETRDQHAKAASAVYEGVKTTLKLLKDCSDVFPPLKTAAATIGSIIDIFETVSSNKDDLKSLKSRLDAILSIIEKYRTYDSLHALQERIKMFCTAITLQSKLLDEMGNQPTLIGVAKGTKDADKILEIVRNISRLCDVFQMDTQLNIEGLVGAIFERQRLAITNRLYHEGTSYRTRTSVYGDASSGCIEGTRVSVLKELEAWALDPTTSKVYWMVGMAGVGKTSIAHTFCQILEEMNILGGNFFASRASTKTDNAYLIIPAIAYGLARASPRTKIEVIKAIEEDDTLAEPTFRNTREHFTKLVYNPSTRANTGVSSLPEKPYKVIVIDALDECSDLDVVYLLVKIVLEMESTLPLKVFISSRDETPISNAFALGNSKARNFHLHNIERNVVQGDIRMYLRHALASIKNEDPERTVDEWPSPTELDGLIAHSGTLFIYAATAVRYIRAGLKLGSGYKARLTEMATRGLESVNGGDPKANLDALYLHVLGKATTGMQPEEIGSIRNLLTLVIFLRIPLTMYAIENSEFLKMMCENTELRVFQRQTFKHHDLQMLVNDARQFLQMNFEAVQNHCMEVYQSALVWLPQKSIIRATYNEEVGKVPKLVVGLSETWGSLEHIIQNGSMVNSVAFSQDGSRMVSGSDDRTVCIWNAMTGEVEAELKDHTNWVSSVAFSQDGSRVVSGSYDKTVCIWNAMTGDVEAELKGHTDAVKSVAFSPDGSQVVSGSFDNTVRIWDVSTGNFQLVASSEPVVLPDGGTVTRTGRQDFHLTYPVQQANSGTNSIIRISNDGQWIVDKSFDCWIPYYSDIWSHSICGSRVCLGCGSGRVVILDMNVQ